MLPVSFFERANKTYFNSVVVIDANGKRLGKYRKSHIPDGPGYQEKFYFTPGVVTNNMEIFYSYYIYIREFINRVTLLHYDGMAINALKPFFIY